MSHGRNHHYDNKGLAVSISRVIHHPCDLDHRDTAPGQRYCQVKHLSLRCYLLRQMSCADRGRQYQRTRRVPPPWETPHPRSTAQTVKACTCTFRSVPAGQSTPCFGSRTLRTQQLAAHSTVTGPSRWTANGARLWVSRSSPQRHLSRISSDRVRWFGRYAFFRRTNAQHRYTPCMNLESVQHEGGPHGL